MIRLVEIDRRDVACSASQQLGGEITPAGAEIGDLARQIGRQRFGQKPRAGIDAPMREHAGRRLETAVDPHRRVQPPQFPGNGLASRRPRETRRPGRDVSAPARPARPACPGAWPGWRRRPPCPGNHDDSAIGDPLERLGDVELVLAAMAAAQHQRGRVAFAFDRCDDAMPLTLQRQEVRPEALHQRQIAVETVGQAKARLGARGTGRGRRRPASAASRPRTDGTGFSVRRGSSRASINDGSSGGRQPQLRACPRRYPSISVAHSSIIAEKEPRDIDTMTACPLSDSAT